MSVALQPTVPVRHWSREQHLAVQQKIKAVLKDVGDTSLGHWETGTLALHHRRPLTTKEALGLGPPDRATPEEIAYARAILKQLQEAGTL